MKLSPAFRRNSFVFVTAAALLFIILIGIAIAVFPGGTYLDHGMKGYSWLNNFFSDLGRTKLYSGEPNTACMLLFSISLAVLGAALVPFFLSWQSLFFGHTIARILARIGCAAGILAGLAYIEIAFTPWDLFFMPHISGVYTAFSAMVLTAVCYSVAMILTPQYSRTASTVMVFYTVSAVLYLMLLLFGPSFKTTIGLVIQVVGQKIIVGVQACTLTIEAGYALKQVKMLSQKQA